MRTTRSYGYFTRSHGLCASTEHCRFQIQVGAKVYCGDKIGDRSDYCNHFETPIGKLCSMVWAGSFNSWNDLKKNIKETKLAAFVLPVSRSGGVLKVENPEEFEHSTKGIEAVLFTTNERIQSLYGTKMRYYAYSFLKEQFEKEITEFNKNGGP